MRRFILLIVLFCNATALPWWAEDTYRWLQSGEWYLLRPTELHPSELEQAKRMANDQEWHWISDRFGNRYQLIVGNSVECLERVTVSQLFASLGVSHIPVFPFLLNRQHLGLPAKADAPTWENACLAPVVSNDERTPEMVSDDSVSQVMVILAVIYSIRAGEQHFAYHRGQFFASRMADIFYNLSVVPRDIKAFLKYTFAGFYWQRAKAFSPHLTERTLRHIRYAFNQLEYIADNSMEPLFGPLMRQGPTYWKRSLTSFQSVEIEWKKRLRESRAQFQDYLQNVLGGAFADASLMMDPLDKREEVLIPKPRFPTPRQWEPVVSISDPVFRRSNAKALLYSYYTGNPAEQRNIEAAWRAELNRDPIAELMGLAEKYDSTTRIFNLSQHPLSGLSDLFVRPQPFLNREAPTTVIVFNGAHQNGRFMSRLINNFARKGADVCQMDTRGETNGLGSDLLGSLRRLVSASGTKRMLIVGGSSALTLQMAIEFPSLERVVMNWGNRGPQDWQKLSCLEQLMTAYNYYPSLPEALITLFEKGGANSMRQLEYGRGDALRAMRRLAIPVDDWFYQQHDGILDASGMIIPIVQREGEDEGVGNSIAVMNYRKTTNYLLWNPGSISLLLDPDLAWYLTNRLKGHPAITSLNWNGDSSLGLFVEINASAAQTRALVEEIVHVIRSWYADHKGLHPCVLPIVHAIKQ